MRTHILQMAIPSCAEYIAKNNFSKFNMAGHSNFGALFKTVTISENTMLLGSSDSFRSHSLREATLLQDATQRKIGIGVCDS